MRGIRDILSTNIMELKDLRITKHRLGCTTRFQGVDYPNTLWRVEGYVFNGYWMIKEECAGKLLQAVPSARKETARTKEEIERIIPDVDRVTKLSFLGIVPLENMSTLDDKPIPLQN